MLQESHYLDDNFWFSSNQYIFLTLFISTIIVFSFILTKKRRPIYPPGPSGLPYVGVIYKLGKYKERTMKRWSLKKYGPVMTVKMVNNKLVILNNYEAIKEAFITNDKATAGRVDSFLFHGIQGNCGITFMDYCHTIITQKSFGTTCFHRQNWEKIINDEMKFLMESLSSNTNKPFNMQRNLFNCCANILTKLIFGRRFNYDSFEMKKFYDIFENILGNPRDAILLSCTELMPFVHRIKPFAGACKRFFKRGQDSMKLIKAIVHEIRTNEHDDAANNSFVGCFIQEQQNTTDKAKEFSDDQLAAYVRDLLGAGIKNTYVTVYWLVLYLLHYSNYEEKITNEIDQILGEEDSSSEKRKQLNITSAYIEEVFRHCTPLPKTLGHKTLCDITVLGCKIPANTFLSGNLWGVHHDPETWPEPELFNPARHLDSDGQFVKSNKVIPFSVGPRSCFGERLGRLAVNIIFTNILQNFKISKVDNSLPSVFEGNVGVTYDPYPYSVILEKR